jgi:two-component system cell cycle response regulator
MSSMIDANPLLTVVAGVLDANGALLEANAGFLRLLPPNALQPQGGNVGRFFIQPSFAALLAAAGSADKDGYRGLLTIGDDAGKTRTLRGRVWRGAGGIHLLAEYDIDELERLNDAMLDLNRGSSLAQHSLAQANVALKHREVQILETSLTDVLTGVGNRRKLEQALATEISRVQRSGGTLSAIMADVDHFKSVNDRYGHGAGDKVLTHLGLLLRSQTRPTDIVARYGGEEFIVLMPDTRLPQALMKAGQFRCALEASLIEPLTSAVTCSFGVAELALEESASSLLGRVDAALYQAKERGRNQVIAAEPAPQS